MRVGNAAVRQLQLDVYGEVLDAFYVARHAGLAPDAYSWALEKALVSHLEAMWREPDEGIWEVRGGLPLVGFLPPGDERVRGTVAAIERRLLGNGLVLRYDTGAGTDGLPEGEGAFLACTFWLPTTTPCSAVNRRRGRCSSALLTLRNDVGLLAEEYDPVQKRQLGNFPQAFSHLA